MNADAAVRLVMPVAAFAVPLCCQARGCILAASSRHDLAFVAARRTNLFAREVAIRQGKISRALTSGRSESLGNVTNRTVINLVATAFAQPSLSGATPSCPAGWHL